MGAFVPLPDTAASPPLRIYIGSVNTQASGNGTSIAVTSGSGVLFAAADATNHAPIMIFGAGASPRQPLWTTVVSVSGPNDATVADAAGQAYTGQQTVVFREIAYDPDDYVLTGTIRFEGSLTTRPTFQFTTFSLDGQFVPQTGAPILVTHNTFGDIFGGSIDQVQISNLPGIASVETQCQCVSWDQIAARRLLVLTDQFPTGDTTDIRFGDGSLTSFPLSKQPTNMVRVEVDGVPQTFGPYSDSSVQWHWALDVLVLDQNGGTPIANGAVLGINYNSVGGQITGPSFTNLPASSIVGFLQVALAEEGVVGAIASGTPLVDLIQFTTRDMIGSALDALVQYINNGTANYFWYIDPRRVLHFGLQGAVAAPWDVDINTNSDENVLIQVSNTITREKFSDAAYVEIANALGASELPDRFLGDGHTRTFHTTYPVGQTPTITLYPTGIGGTGTPQTVGLNGSSGFQWYWQPGSTAIDQDIGGTTLTSSPQEVLDLQYIPELSLAQTFINTTATAARAAIESGSGEYDSYANISNTLPFVLVDGTTIAATIAAYFAALSQKVTLTTHRGGLQVGQAININLPEIQASGTYIIDRVIMTDPNNLALWSVECVAGAVIGDWKTALKSLSGTSQSAAFGGGQSSAGSSDLGDVYAEF